MQLGLLFRILRSRFLLIATLFAITTGAALLGSLLMTKKYASSSELHIDVSNKDPITGQQTYTQQTPQQYLSTQVDIIRSDRVVRRVVDELGLDKKAVFTGPADPATGALPNDFPALRRNVLKGLDANPSVDGSTITLTYESVDPNLSASIVNAFAQAYVRTVADLKSEPAKAAAAWFDEEAADSRRQLEAAQKKLSDFSQTSGIVAKDEQFDVENQRLNSLSQQLVQAEATAATAQAQMANIRKGGRDSLAEVASNGLIQSLTSDVSRAEANVRTLGSRLGENNPSLAAARAELASVRGRLAQEIGRVGGSVERTAQIAVQSEATLKRQLDEQRQRVLKLKTERDQMTNLQRDVDTKQRAYDQLVQRFQDTKVSSRAALTNVTLLSQGVPAADAARPQPVLNTIVGAFLGLVIGILTALVLEMMQRPVRTADDLLESAGLPVLAVLPPSSSNRPQRLIGGGGTSTVRQPTLRLGN